METETAPKTVIRKQIPKVVPYLDPKNPNMGLTKEGLALFEGAAQREQLACLERNGVKRWLTGLNEFAPEIINEKDAEKKAALINDIRTKVIFLERTLGANDIDIDDPKFWDKVKTVYPTHDAFWSNVFLDYTNEPLFLDPEKPDSLILLCAIEAGGFSGCGKSFEDVKNSAVSPKFYLDKAEDTAGSKTEIKKIRNQAGAMLQKLFSSDQRKLFYVIKIVDTNSYRYKNSTSMDVIYEYLDNYLNGEGAIKSVKLAAKTFMDACALSPEDLKLKAVIADASFHRIILTKSDGLVYHGRTDSMVGRNVAEILTNLKNPLNSKTTEAILAEVEKLWAN
jgi:hypothetical protein